MRFGWFILPINTVTVAISAVVISLVVIFVVPLFRCPKHLRHLPQVPLIPTIISFVSGETEERRVKRLLLPTARRCGSGIVVLWALGDWYVHIVDYKLAKVLMDNKTILKQKPREEMLFWRLTGSQNVVITEGDVWRQQVPAVRRILQTNVPMHTFVSLGQKLMSLMGNGGRITWNHLAHRFALDVVGFAVMGHDFEALERPNNSLVKHYREVMSEITHPLYIAFPILERLLPRRRLTRRVDELRREFLRLLELKRENPGLDYVSFILERPPISESEYLDNVVTMFMAGHDTTAGALSTVVYYLAKHPQFQERARSEVVAVLGPNDDPSVRHFQEMPFMNACVREALRLNGPSVMTIPRVSKVEVHLGPYTIPPTVPMVLNLYGILHYDGTWTAPDEFVPDRWVDKGYLDDAWLPFGTGLRRCPAMNFSVYEQRTVLAMLLCKFEWSLPVDSPHTTGLRNGLSTFALNLPTNLDIEFRTLGSECMRC